MTTDEMFNDVIQRAGLYAGYIAELSYIKANGPGITIDLNDNILTVTEEG